MIHHPILKPLGLMMLCVMLALSACGGEKDDSLPPTLASLDDLATDAARQTAQVPVSPTVPVEQGAASLSTPTETLSASPTPTHTPSATPTDDLTATSAAQTWTAQAQLDPITQTVDAIRNATASATALYTLTPPTATESPTPSVTPTSTPPPEPFRVVFYSNRAGNDDIYLVALNGMLRAVTTSPANEREPSCSNDSSAVVYASDASGTYQIYRLTFGSDEPEQLTTSEGMNFAPVYNPSGTTIAFVSTRLRGIPSIWLMNADGSNQRQLTSDLGRDTSPAWGPDGRQLVFASDQSGAWNLFLTVIDEVEGEFPLLPAEFNQGNQVWPSFDALGERIAYTVWDNLENPQTADIYILDYEESEPLALRTGPEADIVWGWADENQLLASVGGPDDVQIALVDINTGEAALLSDAGTFNGGARLCEVDPSILPPEPAVPPTSTPEPPTATPTATATAEITLTSYERFAPPALLDVQGHTHIVQRGENLMWISGLYGVSITTLVTINHLPDPNKLMVGQKLIVPVTRTGHIQGGYQHPDSDLSAPGGFVEKKIVVDLADQKMYAYEGGRLVRTVTVSTGLPTTPTVQGDFKIYQKLLSQTMSGPGYFLPNVPYVMYFYQGYGLHGTYWHDNFGHPMSHGCVNLPTAEAKWLFDWAEIGTSVEVEA